jgi:hypothetical protein
LALVGSLLAVTGIVVVWYQTVELSTGYGPCFGGPCSVPPPRYEEAVPTPILAIWLVLSLSPLVTLVPRRGFRIGFTASAVLAGVTAFWGVWVEPGVNVSNPVLLFQGTLAVCVGAVLSAVGYWSLRRLSIGSDPNPRSLVEPEV